MAAGIYTGYYAQGILISGSNSNPATITGTVRNNAGTAFGGDAVLGFTAQQTVTNSGRVTSNATSGSGIDLRSGGVVSNVFGTAGYVSGFAHGIIIAGGNGVVTNSGVVRSSGTTGGTGIGIDLENGGTVSNVGGPITIAGTGGLVQASRIGILINGTTGTRGTVVNSGIIQGGTAGAVYLGIAGSVQNSGSISFITRGISVIGAATISNLGTITGGVGSASNAAAIYTNNTAATVTNTGRITQSATSGAGVLLNQGGTFTNQPGTIAVTPPIVAAEAVVPVVVGGTGLVTSLGNGVVVNGAAGTVTNGGTITGSAGYAVQLNQGGTIVNSTGGRLNGRSGVSITGTLSSATVANSGSIAGTYGNGATFATGGTVTNIGSASVIRGSGSFNNAGIRIGTSANVITLDSPGVAAATPGTFRISNGGTIVGNANGIDVANAAASGMILNSGSIVQYNQSGAAVRIAGPGTVVNYGAGAIIAYGNYATAVTMLGTSVNSLSNAGRITASSTSSTGVAIRYGVAKVANQAGGYIAGSFYGVDVGSGNVPRLKGAAVTQATSATDATVTNAGRIAVSGSGAFGSTVGVNVSGGGTVVNMGTGSIAGANYGVRMRYGAGTIINAGSIFSNATYAATLAAGYNNRVIVYPQAVFVGRVDGAHSGGLIASATSIVATSPSVLELHTGAAGATGTLTGLGSSFINFGTVVVDPSAHWVLTQINVNPTVLVDIEMNAFAEVSGTAGLAQTFAFDNTSGVLKLDNPNIFASTIANFAVGDTVAVVGTVSPNTVFSNGVLTISNSGTIETLKFSGDFTGKTFIVTQNGNESDITLGARVTASVSEMYTFAYVYGGANGDYYYGTVTANSGQYSNGQIIRPATADQSGSQGYYQILNDIGATNSPFGSVYVTNYYARVNAGYYTPYFWSKGQSDGTNGLGSEFDYLNTNGNYNSYFGNISGPGSGSSYPYYEASLQPQTAARTEFEFVYVYGGGGARDYYYGSVVANAGTYQLNQTISDPNLDPSGNRGTYTILYNNRPSSAAVGTVNVSDYFSQAAQTYYKPYLSANGRTDGSAGLGSEFDYLNLHGNYTSYFGTGPNSGSPNPTHYRGV